MDCKTVKTISNFNLHLLWHSTSLPNYFPMIVNSDERQWGWMDEGLDTFMQYLREQEFGESYPESIGAFEKYPSRRGDPQKIVPYMAGEQSFISPIMSVEDR